MAPNVPKPPDNPDVVEVFPNPLNNGAADDAVVFNPPKPPAPNALNDGADEADV